MDFVAQNLSRAVDVGVLVDQAVGGDGVDQLDVVVEAFGAGDAVGLSHVLATEAGFGPEKDRDGRFDGILSQREDGPLRAAARGLESQSTGPSTGHTDIAGDGSQHTSGADNLFAIGAALHAVALIEHAGLERGVFAGDAGDGSGRDGGDRLGPIRGFGNAIARAQQVIGVAFGVFQAGGHLGGIPTETMRADKVGIVEFFGQHDVGHGAHHGGVGAGADGNPLVGQGSRGERVTRVDADHSGAVLAGELDEVVGVGAIAHFGRVPAPHQDVAAVEPVLPLIAGDQRAVDGGRGRVDGRPGVGVVDAETAAVQVHQAAGDV